MANRKKSADIETALRKSADKFADDLASAREAGLSVTWPGRIEDLRALQVSATAATERWDEEPEPPAAEATKGSTQGATK